MRLLGWLFAKIPYRVIAAFGAALGWLIWAARIRRKVVLENLARAFPEKSDAERLEIARRTFLSLGQMLFDFLRVPYLPAAELERVFVAEGWDCYERAAARGTGVVACTAHFGNFEALAGAHTMRGVPITTISRQMADNWINRAWRAFRHKSGVDEIVVQRNATFKAASRALKARRVLGFVIDQNDTSRSAVFPTFFGVPAATSPTPAWLALRTGAAVVFVLSYPLGDGRHRVILEGPLEVPDTGDRDRDVLAFMQDLSGRLERWIRERPEQWYWLHRRWKTRPPGTN
jgi:KDO2-lipid IV(A) lauroyltransferase